MFRIKKFMITGVIISASVVALTGCQNQKKPQPVVEEVGRDISFTEKKLYVKSYDMDVSLNPAGKTLTASVTAELNNNTDESLQEILFRLPSDKVIKGGKEGLTWEVTGAYLGTDTSTALEHTIDPQDSSLIKVSLGDNKLDPSKEAMITVAVKEDIPEEDFSFGHFTAGDHDQFVLSGCFPKVVEYHDNDWVINDTDTNTYPSQATNYHVKVDKPEGYTVIGTGVEIANEGDTRVNAVDSRDFAMVITNSAQSSYVSNGNLTINLFYPDGTTSQEMAEDIVKQRIPISMDWMEDYLRKYPWNQYDMVLINTDYQSAAFPGLMVFGGKDIFEGVSGDDFKNTNKTYQDRFRNTLLEQWFGQIIGCNKKTDAWLSKGLIAWFSDYMSVKTFGEYEERKITDVIKEMKKQHPQAMDMKLSDTFPDEETADLVNTYRGAELIEELYQSLENDDFFLAMKDYFSKYDFKEASSEDFINIMKDHSKTDIQNIVDKYF